MHAKLLANRMNETKERKGFRPDTAQLALLIVTDKAHNLGQWNKSGT